MNTIKEYCASVSVSVQSLDRSGRQGDVRDDSAEILFQSSLQEAVVGSSRMGRDAHSFDVVHSAFPLPTLQGVLTDGL